VSLLFSIPSFLLWGSVLTTNRSAEWIPVLVLFVASGALGGFLGPLQLPDVATLMRSDADDHFRIRRVRNVLLAFLVSAGGGVGGAFALLFLMLLDDKVRFPSDSKTILLYVSSGVLAGFLGFQFLKVIAANLLKNLGLLQDAERKVEDLRRRGELRSAVTLGLFDLGDSHARMNNVGESIATLEALLPDFPAERRPNMVLANLYGLKKRDYAKAIEILTEYVKQIDRTARSGERVFDRADALYNLACFQAMWADSLGPSARRTELVDKAIESLRQALQFDPALVKDVATDITEPAERPAAAQPDPESAPLRALRGDARLDDLLAAGGLPRRAPAVATPIPSPVPSPTAGNNPAAGAGGTPPAAVTGT
jgi:hypothetical protein